MEIDSKLQKWRVLIAVFALCAPMLVACANSGVPVPIHGVNHRAEEFSYVLIDPADATNTGGGELIEPFSAGGTMCCYTLPAKWRPGIKVEIRETHPLPKLPDGSFQQVTKKYIVEVPKYVGGEAGELWVIREPDGNMDIVSSNYQPNHPKWPGKIKGWPVPSLEYQRARQDLYIKEAQSDVNLFVTLLKELKEDPVVRAREAWASSEKYEPKELKGYSGPNDATYLVMLRRSYESSLADAEKKLQHEKDARP